MKKIIIAFAAGQGLQLLVNYLSHDMVYQNQQVMFCAGAGTIVLVAMIIGAWPTLWNQPEKPRHTYIEHAQVPEEADVKINQIFGKRPKPIEDMDEVAPIPDEVSVTNTSVTKEVSVA